MRSRARRHATSQDLQRDGFWLLRLCSLADACVWSATNGRAERLYELLLPFADRNAIALTQLPFGPVALRLGTLAALLERLDEAERVLRDRRSRAASCSVPGPCGRACCSSTRRALAPVAAGDAGAAPGCSPRPRRLSEDLGLEGILERVDAARGWTRRRAAAPEARFVREGEFWTIAYEGTTMRLRDVKGLRYIALLLAAPGRERARARAGRRGRAAAPGATGLAEEGLRASRPADLGPLSTRAPGRSTGAGSRTSAPSSRRHAASTTTSARRGLEEELDALVGELARAAGLGGPRSRRRLRPPSAHA